MPQACQACCRCPVGHPDVAQPPRHLQQGTAPDTGLPAAGTNRHLLAYCCISGLLHTRRPPLQTHSQSLSSCSLLVLLLLCGNAAAAFTRQSAAASLVCQGSPMLKMSLSALRGYTWAGLMSSTVHQTAFSQRWTPSRLAEGSCSCTATGSAGCWRH